MIKHHNRNHVGESSFISASMKDLPGVTAYSGLRLPTSTNQGNAYSPAHRPDCWRNFVSWGSLLTNDFNLCPVDRSSPGHLLLHRSIFFQQFITWTLQHAPPPTRSLGANLTWKKIRLSSPALCLSVAMWVYNGLFFKAKKLFLPSIRHKLFI